MWQLPAPEPAEVVCLNDVAPYNMVFDDDRRLSGWIDVDTASPGPRVWDLAYLAYRLAPSTTADDTIAAAGTERVSPHVELSRQDAAWCATNAQSLTA